MNTDAKVLKSKITSKTSSTMTKDAGMKDSVVSIIHHINKMKGKTHNDLIRCRKGFDKIQQSIVMKEETYLNMIKTVHSKPIANINLNGENLKTFQ